MAISEAVDTSAKARVVGIKPEFKDLRQGNILFLPQRIALFGQGNTASTYATTKRQVTSAAEAANLYGFGSPLHLAVERLLPVNGDGVGTIPVTLYPLVDDGSGVEASGDITPGGAQTESASYKILINNIESEEFVIAIGDAVADITLSITTAINAKLGMPVIAVDGTTVVDLTSKWKGESANDLFIEVVGSTTAGTTFALTQFTGGLVNPDIDAALAQMGDVWETMILNCLDIADTTTLDKYVVFGEGRWNPLLRKPLVVYTGNTATTVGDATAVSDARKTDRTNAQLVAPASNNLPFVVAARQLARIASVSNNNPPVDYGSRNASGLIPGADGLQWSYADRDEAVKKGSSTTQVKDGVINISDTLTFFHPDGDPIPAYSYVVDIVKIQNVLFNLDLIFATSEWDGAPLVADDDVITNPAAKQPRMAVADVAAMLDSLGRNAIISNVADAKDSIVAGISESNPKRLDIAFTVQISGNVNILSIDFNFGFFFGSTPIVT